ncbi:hypothetical protein ACFL45_08500 [Candidatus Neomarinimicrobiota bacterium]
MKKVVPIIALSLLPLLLAGVAGYSLAGERELPIEAELSWVYVSVAECPTARCFDEAIWKALENVASVEPELPDRLQTIIVQIRPDEHVAAPVELTFTRSDLQRLINGGLSPDQFLRELVVFS